MVIVVWVTSLSTPMNIADELTLESNCPRDMIHVPFLYSGLGHDTPTPGTTKVPIIAGRGHRGHSRICCRVRGAGGYPRCGGIVAKIRLDCFGNNIFVAESCLRKRRMCASAGVCCRCAPGRLNAMPLSGVL